MPRRRLQRHRRAPRQPRRDALGGIARATSEAAGVQAADGLDLSLAVFAEWRLQPAAPVQDVEYVVIEILLRFLSKRKVEDINSYPIGARLRHESCNGS